jgi:hypothetical protein
MFRNKAISRKRRGPIFYWRSIVLKQKIIPIYVAEKNPSKLTKCGFYKIRLILTMWAGTRISKKTVLHTVICLVNYLIDTADHPQVCIHSPRKFEVVENKHRCLDGIKFETSCCQLWSVASLTSDLCFRLMFCGKKYFQHLVQNHCQNLDYANIDIWSSEAPKFKVTQLANEGWKRLIALSHGGFCC